MTTLNKKIENFTKWEILSLIFHPVLLVILTPIRLFQSLGKLKILLNDGNRNYLRFTAEAAFTHLFYWVMYENIDKYGREGTSKIVANGNFPISTWFHQKKFPLKIYRNFSCLTTVIGVVLWVLSFFIWADSTNLWWVTFAVAALFFSASSYYQMFVFQNYNILGWLFLPIAMFSLNDSNLLLLAISASLIASVSLTAMFILGIMSAIFFLMTFNLMIILALVPALIISLIPVYYLIKSKVFSDTLMTYARNLGFIKSNEGYKRSSNHVLTIVYGLLFTIYAGLHYVISEVVPFWTIIALGIFYFNQLIGRFADFQSIWIVLTTSVMIDFMMAPDILLVIPLLLALNPINQHAFTIINGHRIFGMPTVYSPFPISKTLKHVNFFLKDVEKGQRVLLAFENPARIYKNIFDGYSRLMETLSFVGTQSALHVFPDWHIIFMADDHVNIFGRSLAEVEKNANHWSADFVIIYQSAGTQIDPKWNQSGFEIVSTIDWRDLNYLNNGQPLLSGIEIPQFWLLKKGNGNAPIFSGLQK